MSSAACSTHRVRPPSAKLPQPACRTSDVAVKRFRTVLSADQMTLPQADVHPLPGNCLHRLGDQAGNAASGQPRPVYIGTAQFVEVQSGSGALCAADEEFFIEAGLPEHACRRAVPDDVLRRKRWLDVLNVMLRRGQQMRNMMRKLVS